MRRLLAPALLLAMLVVVPAVPAFAYERKRTVSVGVDSEGVPVKIDLTVSDAGGSTKGSRRASGGGTACQYTLAGAGAGGLYAGKPLDVNLYSITCGAYTDVRWLRTGSNGQPLQPGPTVDPFQLALSARDRLPVPSGGIGANPTRSLVGLPTWFWYEGYDGHPLTRTTSAFGVTVQVQAIPTGYRWDFGDGTTMTSSGLGRPTRPTPRSPTPTRPPDQGSRCGAGSTSRCGGARMVGRGRRCRR